jgi:dihydropteroate synthase
MNHMDDKLGVTRIGDRVFRWGSRTYIMGIINVSPDSFSGDGHSTLEAALERAKRMVEEGADIIDVGGESTRPDSQPVEANKEIQRVVPFIQKARGMLGVPISVDTYKIEVAQQALEAGADLLNDISGLTRGTDLIGLAAGRNAPIIITSNQRGNPAENIIKAVRAQLKKLIDSAVERGVSRENIIIDPGVGFGKTVEQNLEIIRRLDELKKLGRPVLLGTSRKSFIGAVLDMPPGSRLEGTAATVAIGISRGADIIRVHDVREMKLIAKMSDAVMKGMEKE